MSHNLPSLLSIRIDIPGETDVGQVHSSTSSTGYKTEKHKLLLLVTLVTLVIFIQMPKLSCKHVSNMETSETFTILFTHSTLYTKK